MYCTLAPLRWLHLTYFSYFLAPPVKTYTQYLNCGLNHCYAFKLHLPASLLSTNYHLSMLNLHLSSVIDALTLWISFHTFLGQSPLTMYHSTLFTTHYLMTLGTGCLSHISEMLVLCKESELFSLPSPLSFYKVLLLLYIVLCPYSSRSLLAFLKPVFHSKV